MEKPSGWIIGFTSIGVPVLVTGLITIGAGSIWIGSLIVLIGFLSLFPILTYFSFDFPVLISRKIIIQRWALRIYIERLIFRMRNFSEAMPTTWDYKSRKTEDIEKSDYYQLCMQYEKILHPRIKLINEKLNSFGIPTSDLNEIIDEPPNHFLFPKILENVERLSKLL